MEEKLDLCELSKESMMKIEGGMADGGNVRCCSCTCWAVTVGGSDTGANASANSAGGLS